MKTTAFAVAVAAILLASCAHYRPAGSPPFDPLNPRVYVVGKQIVVNQEPIYISFERKDVTIVWHLPRGSPYTFPSDGIVVEPRGREELRCNGRDQQQFTCFFRNTRRGEMYKYTINVEENGQKLRPLDPHIVSDF